MAGIVTATRPLGAHTTTAGGLSEAPRIARRLGYDAVQIFTRNRSTWRAAPVGDEEALEFRDAAEGAGLRALFSHASYLINLCSEREDVRLKSRAALVAELERCAALGVSGVVLHPGSPGGAGREAGIEMIAAALDDALEQAERRGAGRVRILLEGTAGQGATLGGPFEDLADLLAAARRRDRLAVCLDTCHAFAYGYDVRTRARLSRVLDEFDRIVGLERLALVHLNDSKTPLGARRDRHEHIGEGWIGLGGFDAILNEPRIAGAPMILETPKTAPGFAEDVVNLARLRSCLRA